jgi:hypothetical protein
VFGFFASFYYALRSVTAAFPAALPSSTAFAALALAMTVFMLVLTVACAFMILSVAMLVSATATFMYARLSTLAAAASCFVGILLRLFRILSGVGFHVFPFMMGYFIRLR